MNLLFDFTVDKATNTIHITREFAADLVWDAMGFKEGMAVTSNGLDDLLALSRP